MVKQTIFGKKPVQLTRSLARVVWSEKSGCLANWLAKELERTRLSEPRIVVDKGIKYSQHYNLSGGVYFSFIFGKSSKEVLGWSTGAHGLRHGYAQDRMSELLELGFARAERMGVISQELGHFRPDIVIEYLR